MMLLACCDACVIALACGLAAWWRVHAGLGPATPATLAGWTMLSLGLFAVPMGLLAMRMLGLYKPWRDRRMLAEAKRAAQAALVTVIALIVVLWAVGNGQAPQAPSGTTSAAMPLQQPGVNTFALHGLTLDGPRFQLAALALLMPALLIAERSAFRVLLRELRKRGKNLRHVVVIGTGRLGRIACRTLDRNSWTGIHVAYFIDHAEQRSSANAPEICGRSVKGGLADLELLLEHEPVDAVYLALPTSRASKVPELLRRLERFPVDVRIIPDVSPRHTPLAMSVSELEGMPILSVRECPINGPAAIVKRALDVVGAVCGLVVFAVPMLVIACVIRATSPGPAMFTQRRVSLGGEEFEILKFRTMRPRSATSGWTQPNDPRVTPFGKWLRRTSLDELPQLLNVLMGDMSLVGPRPERPELIDTFREDWRGYMLRQHVKAGMTGWAQVNGHRGNTSLRKRLQHDLFYIKHWSLGFDIKILWLTLFRGFFNRNAY
jgi:Undecaprenyl-phosphate glucose phosphotransferase